MLMRNIKTLNLVTEYIDNTICGHDDLVRHIEEIIMTMR